MGNQYIYIELFALIVMILTFIDINSSKTFWWACLVLILLNAWTGFNSTIITSLITIHLAFWLFLWGMKKILSSSIFTGRGYKNKCGDETNNGNKAMFLSIVLKTISILGIIVFSILFFYWLFLFGTGKVPLYFYLILLVPLLAILNYIGRSVLSIGKKFYYLNFVLPEDLRALEEDLTYIGVWKLFTAKERAKAETLRAQPGNTFVINFLRHTIPEKKIIDILQSKEKEENSIYGQVTLDTIVHDLTLYKRKMEELFGMTYISEISRFYNEEIKVSDEEFMKKTVILYMAHTVSNYEQKKEYFDKKATEKDEKHKAAQKQYAMRQKDRKKLLKAKENYSKETVIAFDEVEDIFPQNTENKPNKKTTTNRSNDTNSTDENNKEEK